MSRPLINPIVPSKEAERWLYETLRRLQDGVDVHTQQLAAIDRGEAPSLGGNPLLGVTKHSDLLNLTSPYDDHTQYAHLPGRVGGQILNGGAPAPNSPSGDWSDGGNFTSKNNKTSLSTWSSIAIDTTAAIGSILVLGLATLPFSLSINALTKNHLTLTDTKGNTWTKVKEYTFCDAFGAGTCYSIWTCTVTSALTAGTDTLTATFSAAIGAQAISSHKFTGNSNTLTLASISVLGEQSFVGPEPSALTFTGLTADKYLFVRHSALGQFSGALPAYVATTNYNAFDHGQSGTSGGSGNVASYGEYRILTGVTGDTSNPAVGGGGSYVSVYLAFVLAPASTGSLILQSSSNPTSAKVTLNGTAMSLGAASFNVTDAFGTAFLTLNPLSAQILGTGAHTGGTQADLVIEGRLMVGTGLSGINFTSGRALEVRPIAVNGATIVNLQPDLTQLSGVASGTLTMMQVAVAGTPAYTSGSFTARGFFFTASPTIPTGVTLTEALGAAFTVTPALGGGTISKQTALRLTTATPNNGGTIPLLVGLNVQVATRVATSTLTHHILLDSSVSNSGTTSGYIGIEFGTGFNVNTVVNYTGIHIPAHTSPTGTILGLDIAVAKNRLAGLHLGTGTSGVHFLEIEACTTTRASILLTTGTVLTAAAAGAIEFVTDDLFFTITTGTARKAFILDDGTRLTSGRVPFAFTNGRLVDDADFTFSVDTLTITKIATTSITDSGLTSGRVTFAGTAGLLSDDADLTFTTDTLGATKIQIGSLGSSGTHFLEIAAGTTSKAPIRFTSGTNLTTPASGVLEYDGYDLLLTDDTPNRSRYTERELGRNTSINMKNTGNTTLFTVPTGRTAVVTKVVIIGVQRTAITVGPTWRVGTNNSVSRNDIVMDNTTDLLVSQEYLAQAGSGVSGNIAQTASAGQVIDFNVATGSTGTAQAYAVYLFGYLI